LKYQKGTRMFFSFVFSSSLSEMPLSIRMDWSLKIETYIVSGKQETCMVDRL
jgi:hypothetical protein